MSKPTCFILNIREAAQALEDQFCNFLVTAEVGYYRYSDLKPFLALRENSGITKTYYVKDPNHTEMRPVTDLSRVCGVIYDDNGARVARIYKVGDVQTTPQQPVIGIRIVLEYLRAFFEMSRSYLKYTDTNIATRTLLDRFEHYFSPEHMQSFIRTSFGEHDDHYQEVTVGYLTKREVIPGQDHIFGNFLKAVVDVCHELIQPFERYVVENGWTEFQVNMLGSGDVCISDNGDFRINEWHLLNKDVKGI